MNKCGYVHNDIKPENIMLSDSKVGVDNKLVDPQFKIIDFAYASKECIVAGTSTYFSPE
jgi:serine/threonine protein kinase